MAFFFDNDSTAQSYSYSVKADRTSTTQTVSTQKFMARMSAATHRMNEEARIIRAERERNRIASLDEVRRLSREPVVRLGASRVTTGGAGIRPRNALPPSFSFYQGEH